MLYLLNSPELAHHVQICTIIKSGSLLSMSQLCDQGFKLNFTVDQVSVTLDNQTILTGPRNNITGLWIVPLVNQFLTQAKPWVPLTTKCKYMHRIPTVQPPAMIHQASNNLLYLHALLFSPVVYTSMKAINIGNFASWTRLTSDLVNKHLLKSQATYK